MRKDITYVDRSKLEAIIAEKGLTVHPQAKCLQVSTATPGTGYRVYVSLSSRVGFVDISGFDAGPTIQSPARVPNGRVTGQLIQTGTEDEVLARFAALLDLMVSLPPPAPKPPKAPRAPKATKPTTDGEVAQDLTAQPDDSLQARLDLIKKVAAEHGVPVSASTLALAEK